MNSALSGENSLPRKRFSFLLISILLPIFLYVSLPPNLQQLQETKGNLLLENRTKLHEANRLYFAHIKKDLSFLDHHPEANDFAVAWSILAGRMQEFTKTDDPSLGPELIEELKVAQDPFGFFQAGLSKLSVWVESDRQILKRGATEQSLHRSKKGWHFLFGNSPQLFD